MAIAPRHRRFLGCIAAGLTAAALAALIGPSLGWTPDRGGLALIGTDVTFAGYLLASVMALPRMTPDLLRRHADIADEGIGVITMLAVAVCATSLLAVFVTLNGVRTDEVVRPALALASVPLGWTMLHMLAGFHYAGLWYGRGPEARGLTFPGGTTHPGMWDFLYFSYGVGMTAQVSDVTITAAPLRRTVTIHAMLSFFYNTVLLALAVNAAVSLSGG